VTRLEAFRSNPTHAVLALLAIAGLVLRGLLVCLPLDRLLGLYLADDAFYYFTMARGMARGGPPALDGETLNNGFHPLWMLVCRLVYAGWPDGDTPIRILLGIGAFMDVGAGVLGFFLVRRVARSGFAALACSALMFLSPWSAVKRLNGLETSLVLLLEMVVLLLLARCLEGGLSRARTILLGAACGLLMLARTDMVILAGPVMAAVLLFAPGPWRGRIAATGAGVAIASALLAPWLLWCWSTFGSVVQVSGEALTLRIVDQFAQETGAAPGSLAGWLRRADLFLGSLGRAAREAGLGRLGFASLALLPLAAALARPRGRPWPRAALPRSAAVLLGVVIAFGIAYLGVHAFGRWSVREWYLAHLLPGVLALLGLGLALLEEGLRARPAPSRALLASVLVLFALAGCWRFARRGGYAGQPALLEMCGRLTGVVAPDERLGAFNAGILSYCAPVPVVNLDGAVNREAYEALGRRALLGYVCRKGVAVVVDQERYVLDRYGRYWEPHRGSPGAWLRPVATVEAPLGPLRAYRIECRAESGRATARGGPDPGGAGPAILAPPCPDRSSDDWPSCGGC
jgi:hypothetical protein